MEQEALSAHTTKDTFIFVANQTQNQNHTALIWTDFFFFFLCNAKSLEFLPFFPPQSAGEKQQRRGAGNGKLSSHCF